MGPKCQCPREFSNAISSQQSEYAYSKILHKCFFINFNFTQQRQVWTATDYEAIISAWELDFDWKKVADARG
jgi:hypothetical protein